MSDIEPVVTTADLLPVCGSPGCGIVARPDQALCDDHAVQQRVMAARRKLAEHAPSAAERLIDLCENADHADVRRRAAEAILDRVGVRPGVEVAVSPGPGSQVSPADLLRAKLQVLRDRTTQAVEAEVDALEGAPDGSVLPQIQRGKAQGGVRPRK